MAPEGNLPKVCTAPPLPPVDARPMERSNFSIFCLALPWALAADVRDCQSLCPLSLSKAVALDVVSAVPPSSLFLGLTVGLGFLDVFRMLSVANGRADSWSGPAYNCFTFNLSTIPRLPLYSSRGQWRMYCLCNLVLGYLIRKTLL